MVGSESAEVLVRMTLEGMEVALKIAGSGAKNLAVMLYTMAKDKKTTKGKTNLNNLLKSGSELKVFSLRESDLKKFKEVAGKYGVLYSVLIDKKDKDGMVDILTRKEDALRVNRIVDRFKLSTVNVAEIKSEIEKDQIDKAIKEALEKGIEIKSDEEKLVDDIIKKPIQTEKTETENVQVSKTEKKTLSEHLLGSKNKNEGNTKKKRPSVRAELKKIKEELQKQDTPKENSKNKEVKSNDHKKVINSKPKKKSKRKER